MSKGKWKVNKDIERKLKKYFAKKDANAKPSNKKSK